MSIAFLKKSEFFPAVYARLCGRYYKRVIIIMKQYKKQSVFFAVGSVGYGMIEWLWRGRTHWSMLLAGGCCFMMFSLIARKCCRRSLFYKASLCALGVTAIEFLFGVIFNILLRKNVWDYSDVPFNIMGQICPLYTFLWGVLGLVFLPLADWINRRLDASAKHA